MFDSNQWPKFHQIHFTRSVAESLTFIRFSFSDFIGVDIKENELNEKGTNERRALINVIKDR